MNFKNIRCGHHGRKFNLEVFKSMPDFERTKNFPRDCENLKSFKVSTWPFFIYKFKFSNLRNTTHFFNEISNQMSFLNLTH